MTVTEFLDTNMEKDTDDIIIIDQHGNTLNDLNLYEEQIVTVTYKKIVVIEVNKKW